MNNFPSHDINPSEKGSKWIMQYIKAAWGEFERSNVKMFYGARFRYKEIKDYVLARQSVEKYKKNVLIDEASDSSWVNIDWSIRAIAAKLRDIALSKLVQKGYNIVATPIDLLARDETETYYIKHKAKIRMRDEMLKVNPALAQLPAFAKEHGDPENIQELEMMKDLGVKLKVAMEAEMGIDYVLYRNGFKNLRRADLESLFDYGAGSYKEYVDENNEVRVRDVDIASLVVSACRKADFSDAKYIGELTEVNVCELPFDEETRKDIYQAARSGNQTWTSTVSSMTAIDSQTVQVLDMEFFSYNDRVYERRENKSGNELFRRTDYNNKKKGSMVTVAGKEVQKYVAKPLQVVYKGKWIVGTDYVYDDGLGTYLKRTKPNKATTTLSYHVFAYNFDRMRALGMMERLIPIIDEYHNTIYKVQNFKNKWVPYIINLDIQAMENVALGASGDPMKPKEILELVFQNFVAMGRRMDVSGQLQNYKMVDIEPTGMHQEYTVLVNDLARILSEMRDVTGLNDLTDGSTPGERTLNYVASLGNEATNNALYPITFADKQLTENLSKGVIQRLVLTVLQGDIEGVTRTLGDETVRFIRVTKDIADRVWDVKLEDKPTEAQKELLLQQMNIKDNQGLISPDDVIMITETNNLKQARVQLAYSIEKKKKEMQQYELQKMQENGKIQVQSGQAVEAAKQATLALEYKLKTELEVTKIAGEKELLQMKLASMDHATDTGANVKLLTKHMEGEDKKETQTINDSYKK